MGATAQGRIRGKGSQGTRLVERDWELSALEQALAEARAGAGGAVFIEGPSGIGKSVLLAEAARLASRADMATAQGRGMPLERDFLFGLAIQLFEPLWLAYGAEERPALLAGAANLAAPLLQGMVPAAGGDGLTREPYALIHGLFRVACNLILSPTAAASRPAHPRRRRSPRRRAVVAVPGLSGRPRQRASRSCCSSPPPRVSGAQSRRRSPACAAPPATPCFGRAPLSSDGVAAIARSAFPDAEAAFCAGCVELTAGNPFLVSNLIETLRAEELAPHPDSLSRVVRDVPDAIANGVATRLDELSADARTVATSVAAFPAGASIIRRQPPLRPGRGRRFHARPTSCRRSRCSAPACRFASPIRWSARPSPRHSHRSNAPKPSAGPSRSPATSALTLIASPVTS